MSKPYPVVIALMGLLAAAGSAQAEKCSPAGSSRVLAAMPIHQPNAPPTGSTYPEGIAIAGDRVIVSGPATFGTAGNGSPSQLTVFDKKSGALRAEVPLVGENLTQEHALSELFEHDGYVYAPSTQLGVLRWRFQGHDDTTVQENVSTPFCSVSIPFPCTVVTDKCPADVRPGLPPLPNGMVVSDDGDAYVTDSLQGIVWRIPRAARPATSAKSSPVNPEVLFCSKQLQGSGSSGLGLFGANGIAAVGDWLYVSTTFGPNGPNGPTSVVYRLPRKNPGPGDLQVVYTYQPVMVAPLVFVPPIADGLRYDEKSRHLFVVLGGQNQVSELDLKVNPVAEVTRYSRTNPDHPFFNPSTVVLDGHGSAFVANHAVTCCLAGDLDPACAGCFNALDYFGVIEICLNRD